MSTDRGTDEEDIIYHLYVRSKKRIQMNLLTEQKLKVTKREGGRGKLGIWN